MAEARAGLPDHREYWCSDLTGEGLWGENGQTNGNGQPLFLPDAFFNR
jgi:hypothetical protein